MSAGTAAPEAGEIARGLAQDVRAAEEASAALKREEAARPAPGADAE